MITTDRISYSFVTEKLAINVNHYMTTYPFNTNSVSSLFNRLLFSLIESMYTFGFFCFLFITNHLSLVNSRSLIMCVGRVARKVQEWLAPVGCLSAMFIVNGWQSSHTSYLKTDVVLWPTQFRATLIAQARDWIETNVPSAVCFICDALKARLSHHPGNLAQQTWEPATASRHFVNSRGHLLTMFPKHTIQIVSFLKVFADPSRVWRVPKPVGRLAMPLRHQDYLERWRFID